ncbi:MAG: hypothetical protein RJA22_92 [Verrucomicrobiota bacterium]
MSLLVNLRHLESKNLHLRGEAPAAALDLELGDELVRVSQPVRYDLEVQRLDSALLVQGRVEGVFDCECVRCLKPFRQPLRLDPWACHVALEGEEQAVVANDCVDLTPYLREDIVLAFPQHPLCKPDCRGLGPPPGKQPAGMEPKPDPATSPWTALDKLKL